MAKRKKMRDQRDLDVHNKFLKWDETKNNFISQPGVQDKIKKAYKSLCELKENDLDTKLNEIVFSLMDNKKEQEFFWFAVLDHIIEVKGDQQLGWTLMEKGYIKKDLKWLNKMWEFPYEHVCYDFNESKKLKFDARSSQMVECLETGDLKKLIERIEENAGCTILKSDFVQTALDTCLFSDSCCVENAMHIFFDLYD